MDGLSTLEGGAPQTGSSEGLLTLGASSVPRQLGGCGCGLRAGWAGGWLLLCICPDLSLSFVPRSLTIPASFPPLPQIGAFLLLCFLPFLQPQSARALLTLDPGFCCSVLRSELPSGYPGGSSPLGDQPEVSFFSEFTAFSRVLQPRLMCGLLRWSSTALHSSWGLPQALCLSAFSGGLSSGIIKT